MGAKEFMLKKFMCFFRPGWPKNTTVAKQYGRASETPCFPEENSQEIPTDSELIRR